MYSPTPGHAVSSQPISQSCVYALCVCAVPDSPESVKAVVIAQHPGTSVALVSWTPPKDGTHIAKYLVSVMSKHDDTSLTELQQLVPGVSFCALNLKTHTMHIISTDDSNCPKYTKCYKIHFPSLSEYNRVQIHPQWDLFTFKSTIRSGGDIY